MLLVCIRPAILALIGCAVLLGLGIAWIDVAAPWGDDTAKCILVLWLAAGGVLGFCGPVKPWRWACALGPWLPLVHGIRYSLGLPGSIQPNTPATILILVPIALGACVAGTYAGASLRRACTDSVP